MEFLYLSQAINWASIANEYFWDHDGAGYFNSPNDATDLISRTKTVFDNATPSGNGIMAENLATLYYLTGDQSYRDKADVLITSISQKTSNQGANMPSLMAGFEILQRGIQVIIISKDTNNALTKALFSLGSPNLIFTQLAPNIKLPTNHPAFGKTQINNQVTAYVCRSQTCGRPHTKVATLIADLTN